MSLFQKIAAPTFKMWKQVISDHETYMLDDIKADQRDPGCVNDSVKEMINLFRISGIFTSYDGNNKNDEETIVWNTSEHKNDSKKDMMTIVV